MTPKNRTLYFALQRARMEMSYTTAILRAHSHNPDVQGILQNLQFAIDDAEKLLAKFQPLTREKTNERKRTPKTATPPAP